MQQPAQPTLQQHSSRAMENSNTMTLIRFADIMEQCSLQNISVIATHGAECVIDHQMMAAVERCQTGKQGPLSIVGQQATEASIDRRIGSTAQCSDSLPQSLTCSTKWLLQASGRHGKYANHNGTDPTMAVRSRSYTGEYMALITSAPARPPTMTTAKRTMKP